MLLNFLYNLHRREESWTRKYLLYENIYSLDNVSTSSSSLNRANTCVPVALHVLRKTSMSSTLSRMEDRNWPKQSRSRISYFLEVILRMNRVWVCVACTWLITICSSFCCCGSVAQEALWVRRWQRFVNGIAYQNEETRSLLHCSHSSMPPYAVKQPREAAVDSRIYGKISRQGLELMIAMEKNTSGCTPAKLVKRLQAQYASGWSSQVRSS